MYFPFGTSVVIFIHTLITRSSYSNLLCCSLLSGPVYRIKAVVEHRGTIDSGHFVTYRRGPLKSQIRHRSSDLLDQSESRQIQHVLSLSFFPTFSQFCTSLINKNRVRIILQQIGNPSLIQFCVMSYSKQQKYTSIFYFYSSGSKTAEFICNQGTYRCLMPSRPF